MNGCICKCSLVWCGGMFAISRKTSCNYLIHAKRKRHTLLLCTYYVLFDYYIVEYKFKFLTCKVISLLPNERMTQVLLQIKSLKKHGQWYTGYWYTHKKAINSDIFFLIAFYMASLTLSSKRTHTHTQFGAEWSASTILHAPLIN